MRGIFITGTDTGVGKTVVTASLCRILRSRGIDAVAVKPVATGISHDTRWRDNDPLILAAAINNQEKPEAISPLRMSPALSPFDAARLTNTSVNLDAIKNAIEQVASRHEFAIVEGVGGISVPLAVNTMVSHFADIWNLPALIVARSTIGTINHTVLTAGALKQARIGIKGIVFMRPATGDVSQEERLGTETAAHFAQAESFGLVGYSEALAGAKTLDDFVLALPVADPALVSIADCIMPAVGTFQG